jgi:hypothetical protein
LQKKTTKFQGKKIFSEKKQTIDRPKVGAMKVQLKNGAGYKIVLMFNCITIRFSSPNRLVQPPRGAILYIYFDDDAIKQWVICD